jgi:cytochrome c peroxidase
MKKLLFFTLISSLFLLYANDINDKDLRILAKENGLKSTPTTYQELKIIAKKANNPLTLQKINLGRTLFFEPLLSKDETLTCASCHKLSQGGDDNLPTAIGFKKRVNPKHLNSPTVLDSSLSKFLFWDGRAKSVEEQAGGPIAAHFEMNLTPKELVQRLKKSVIYQEAFKDTFDGAITFENVKKAIGAYERTLLTRGKFDDFLDGNDKAINQEAKKGLRQFIKQGCVKCHYGTTLGGQTMQKFPKFGDAFPFKNTGGFKGKDDKRIIRVPLLRNITKTAPYYHNGSIKSLFDVIKIESKFNTGQELNKRQINSIIEFFKTLDGEIADYGLNG